jgi:hypothetical protein
MEKFISLKMERMVRLCRFCRSERETGLISCSKAYISFGGLLMALEGPYKKLTPLRVDYVYLLIKK